MISQVYANIMFSEKIYLSYACYKTNINPKMRTSCHIPKDANGYGIPHAEHSLRQRGSVGRESHRDSQPPSWTASAAAARGVPMPPGRGSLPARGPPAGHWHGNGRVELESSTFAVTRDRDGRPAARGGGRCRAASASRLGVRL